jgi:hypothetical protein
VCQAPLNLTGITLDGDSDFSIGVNPFPTNLDAGTDHERKL